MQEVWKAIPGFEGFYEASNLGQIRSIDRFVRGVSKSGKEHQRRRKGALLSPVLHSRGYHEVNLCKFGRLNRRLVHQVIASVFLERPDDAQCINHKNGNKQDNRACNLEWCSFSQNAQHAVSTGLHVAARGEKTGFAKLTDDAVREIKRLLSSGVMSKDIAKRFGIAAPQISMIKHGKAWTHVT